MKIREITEYVTQYAHPDVEKQLNKYEKRHRRKIRMGYGPGVMAYPYRVKEEAAGVGIVTKQNATKDVPVGGEYMNVKKLKLAKENFADGKKKGKSRPGRVKRAGASCKGSVSSLRSKAKKYGGERGKMYHWCANMKSGRKK
jgi:hypothetical protein